MTKVTTSRLLAVTPRMEKAWQAVDACFGRFCLTAGIEARQRGYKAGRNTNGWARPEFLGPEQSTKVVRCHPVSLRRGWRDFPQCESPLGPPARERRHKAREATNSVRRWAEKTTRMKLG